MTRVMVPISKLKYASKDAFSLKAYELLNDFLGDHHPEEPYTHTFRAESPHASGTPEFVAWREQAVHDLRLRVEDKNAVERLIALLDHHDWDVSFFIDSF